MLRLVNISGTTKYSLMLLRKDLEKYITYLDELRVIKNINHKKYVFRPINVLLDNFLMYFRPVRNISSVHKIDILNYHGLIDDNQRQFLLQNLNLILYTRLLQHYKFGEQKIDLTENDASFHLIKLSQERMRSMFCFFDNQFKKNDMNVAKKSSALAYEHLRRFA